jgi:hypothetical protein
MDCRLPLLVLKQLEDDLIAQKAQKIFIGIEWEAGLVRNEHAPPSCPTTWGLFKTKENGEPEPLRGHVKLFGWTLSQLSVVKEHGENKEVVTKLAPIFPVKSQKSDELSFAVKMCVFALLAVLAVHHLPTSPKSIFP